MTKSTRQFGNWGEHLAEKYLEERGFEILDRNFRKPCGEIDLICKKGEALHFIEVKTRNRASVEKFGLPQDAVTKLKQRKLIETAFAYLAESGNAERIAWQMDVVSIIYDRERGKARIGFIENAFGES